VPCLQQVLQVLHHQLLRHAVDDASRLRHLRRLGVPFPLSLPFPPLACMSDSLQTGSNPSACNTTVAVEF
jgi:hypothetical protein